MSKTHLESFLLHVVKILALFDSTHKRTTNALSVHVCMQRLNNIAGGISNLPN